MSGPYPGAPYPGAPYPGASYPGAPMAGPFGGPPPQQGGWTPPPKPGLVPLRPLGFGEMLGAAFAVFRRNPRTTFGTALLSQVIVLVIAVLVTGGVALAAFSRVESALPQDRDAVSAGALAITALSTLVPVVLSLVVSAVLQGLFVLETARQTLGEKLRLGGLWALARGRLGVLIGWSLIVAAALLVGLALAVGIIALGVALGGAALVAGIVLGILASLGLVVVALWLTTKFALVPSALVLERMTLGQALRRSWWLTRGGLGFWRTLGLLALVFAMIQFATQVVSTPFSLLFGLLGGTLFPTGNVDDTSGLVVAGVTYLLTIVISAVITAIGSIVQAASIGLVYIDLRIRSEGLDLELVRYVERRAAGATDQPDPYRTPGRP
ncbi:hypothetical protein ACPEEZ_10205 [Frigoribacterium sp. 2-23]|uniref:hypothetical protein n=1 Tax=Frigoribacterium sp. 2-23 TaxID=3415006 RepID=UPI003C7037C7